MSESQLWNDVDDYLIGHLSPHDEVLEATLRDSDSAGLPQIAVSAAAGKLLHLLARIQGATRILEIGTLGGYSTIWLARALPADGRLVTLEYSPQHAVRPDPGLQVRQPLPLRGAEDHGHLPYGQDGGHQPQDQPRSAQPCPGRTTGRRPESSYGSRRSPAVLHVRHAS